eukprot:238848-Prorocentrum_lima.AAC.1
MEWVLELKKQMNMIQSELNQLQDTLDMLCRMKGFLDVLDSVRLVDPVHQIAQSQLQLRGVWLAQ